MPCPATRQQEARAIVRTAAPIASAAAFPAQPLAACPLRVASALQVGNDCSTFCAASPPSLSLRGGRRPTWQSRSIRLNRGKAIGEIATAFPRLHPKGTSSRFALRAPRPLWGLAMTRQGSAAMGTVRRTESAVLLPLRGRAGHAPPLQGQCGLNGGRRMIHSSFFIIHYFIHPPAGDGKPYDKTSGNSLPFVQISPGPPDLSLTTGAFIDKIISENKGAVCPLQQARQPAKNLFVTHDPNTRDQYRRTTQWIKNASLP